MQNVLNRTDNLRGTIGKSKIFTCALILTLVAITQSAFLAAALGVSVATAARVAYAAYSAYRAGRSIRAAVAALLGVGGLVWIAVDFIIGWGAGQVISSGWLQNM